MTVKVNGEPALTEAGATKVKSVGLGAGDGVDVGVAVGQVVTIVTAHPPEMLPILPSLSSTT